MHPAILEKRAHAFRTRLGLTAHDSIRLKSLLARLNVLTVFRPMGPSMSGMAIKVGEGERAHRFMLVNSAKSLGHQHFTIGHELYHLFEQPGFTAYVCHAGQFQRKSGEEYHADVFASYLLLPQAGIESLIPDEEYPKDQITLQTILRIEHYYSCSRRALLYRLKEMGFISSARYDELAQDVKRGAFENGYPTDLYEAGNEALVIGDYGAMARTLYDAERISESHYLSLLVDLGLDPTKLESLQDVGE